MYVEQGNNGKEVEVTFTKLGKNVEKNQDWYLDSSVIHHIWQEEGIKLVEDRWRRKSVDHIGEKQKTLGFSIANLSTNFRGIKLNTFFMCQVWIIIFWFM